MLEKELQEEEKKESCKGFWRRTELSKVKIKRGGRMKQRTRNITCQAAVIFNKGDVDTFVRKQSKK